MTNVKQKPTYTFEVVDCSWAGPHRFSVPAGGSAAVSAFKMTGVLNTSTAYEQRSVIRFLWSKGRTPIEIHRGMQPTYGERYLALRSMRWWCSEFENSRENLNDNEHAGRPRVSVTDPNNARVGAMVKTDRRVRIKYIVHFFWECFQYSSRVLRVQEGFMSMGS